MDYISGVSETKSLLDLSEEYDVVLMDTSAFCGPLPKRKGAKLDLLTENRRILINGILFTDYFEVNEQDKLIEDSEDFFNNWKDYGNDVDVDNVATLNMNYEI